MKLNRSNCLALTMGSRKQMSHKRKIASLVSKWEETHISGLITKVGIIQAVDVSDNGDVIVICKPKNPHCSATLFNLAELRKSLLAIKGLTTVMIKIVEIPGAERWTAAINE